MPARVAHVVIELVAAVPAEDDIAEPEAVFEGGLEFRAGHVLAAQDAIDIERADLDVGQLPLFHDGARVSRGSDLSGFYHRPSIATGSLRPRITLPGWCRRLGALKPPVSVHSAPAAESGSRSGSR